MTISLWALLLVLLVRLEKVLLREDLELGGGVGLFLASPLLEIRLMLLMLPLEPPLLDYR